MILVSSALYYGSSHISLPTSSVHRVGSHLSIATTSSDLRIFSKKGQIFPAYLYPGSEIAHRGQIACDFLFSGASSIFYYKLFCKIFFNFLWEFQFQNFVRGKELWGFIVGSTDKPSESDDLAKWATKNAQVISWILNSVDPSIAIDLRPYNSAAEMWQYLKRVYHQENEARLFQLTCDINLR